MSYDIAAAAQEMMLEPEDLREILEVYLQDSAKILEQCEKEYAKQNAAALAKLFHALKGTSLNLRLNEVGNLAAQLELETKQGSMANVGVLLPGMKKQILAVQDLL